MGQFIKKLLFFLLPLGLLFIFPLAVFYVSREYYTVDMVIEEQLKNPDIVCGLAFSSLNEVYKRRLMADFKPTVVALGSSRVAQFKSSFFKEPAQFFNFGNSDNLHSAESFNRFVKELPSDSQVKFILLSLDVNEFVEGTPLLNRQIVKAENRWAVLANFLKSGWRQVYADWWQHKFSWSELINKARQSKNIGLNAVINGDGHAVDGSYQYNKSLTDPDHVKNVAAAIEEAVASIKRGGDTPEYGASISPATLDFLAEGLRIAQEKNIQVLGFLSPRPSAVWQVLNSSDYVYKDMVRALPRELNERFVQNGFVFYDFSDQAGLNARDTEFVDWVHPTDKMNLRMTIYWAEKNQAFKKYINLEKLQTMLEKNKGDFLETTQL